MIRLIAVVASLIALLAACGKPAPAYKEKTQQERSESYHRDLKTPDLQLFGLRGNVQSAETTLSKGPGTEPLPLFYA